MTTLPYESYTELNHRHRRETTAANLRHKEDCHASAMRVQAIKDRHLEERAAWYASAAERKDATRAEKLQARADRQAAKDSSPYADPIIPRKWSGEPRVNKWIEDRYYKRDGLTPIFTDDDVRQLQEWASREFPEPDTLTVSGHLMLLGFKNV